MPAKTRDTRDPIIRRLRELAKESPHLKDAVGMYEAILPLLRDADLHVGAITLTPDEARGKMEKGQPLLAGLDLDLDVEAVRELVTKLAAAVEAAGRKNAGLKLLPWLRSPDEPYSAARRVRRALEGNRLDISSLLPHIAAGESGPVFSAAKDLQLDPGLLWTLAQNALKPALRAWRRQLTLPAKGIPWNKGACFVCGAGATLAELQENNQAKHLRCGACGADWQVPRLRCAHCGNEDHKTLRLLYDERNRERMGVEACDACKGYLKIISAFTPALPEMLAVEDLATLHLDSVARERGYAPGAAR